MNTNHVAVNYLQRPDGRIAYTVEGTGPLVIAVPGMGDLRSVYRDLIGPLSAAGYRVAVMDLRGHGDSDTTFTVHGDAATGRDILALIDELGEPAVVLGNSMGASAAAWAAAERPSAVTGLVLLGPFLREPMKNKPAQAMMRMLYRGLFAGPWGAATWAKYYASLNKGTPAPWLSGHRADIHRSLRQPGRLRSLRQLAVALNHAEVEVRLPAVTAPSLVFMGEKDPDFRSPRHELAWAVAAVRGEGVLVPEAGHYPHAQQPAVVLEHLLPFLAATRPTAQNPGTTDA
jgi:pimeloyl-ACP methyl ester carboxylesterase